MNEKESRPMGRRIYVVGNTCSGKSTVGNKIANKTDIPFVELDAINFLPNWIGLSEHDPQLFHAKIIGATKSDSWVIAGSYEEHVRATVWEDINLIIWLDLPILTILGRLIKRSWHRWRTRELLWGTNYENFFKHFRIWNNDSLLFWAVTQHAKKRRRMLAVIGENHKVEIARLRSSKEIDSFIEFFD
jgi:adenylate kinase family enzyme